MIENSNCDANFISFFPCFSIRSSISRISFIIPIEYPDLSEIALFAIFAFMAMIFNSFMDC